MAKDFPEPDGILFDLGLNSWQLEKSKRGYSFLKDEPLDMSASGKLTAKEIVNSWPEEELTRIFKKYGQEKYSYAVAQEIVKQRKEKKIETTKELAEVIKKAIWEKRKTHPGTKIFQALRIAANDELENLKKALPQALGILKQNGQKTFVTA